MLAFGREVPLCRRRDLFRPEQIDLGLAREQLPPVDPWTQRGGAGHIGRCGQDTIRQGAVPLRQSIENLTESRLGRNRALGRQGQRRDRQRVVVKAPVARREEWHLVQPGLKAVGIAHRSEAVPFAAFGNALIGLPVRHLRRGHQTAVVVLVTGDGRAPSLDRIGQKAGRAIVVDGGEGLGHGLDAVAAQVLHQFGQFVVRTRVNQCRDVPLIPQRVHQMFAPDRSALVGQRGIELVRTGIDPLPQRLAPWLAKGGTLQGAIFDAHDVPAEGLEDLLDPLPQPFPNHTVKRLPVIIDHPPGVAQPVLPAFLQALVDIALVEFSIAHQRDHPARSRTLTPGLGADIVLNQGCKRCDGDTESDRPGREVHIVIILGPAGIALRPAQPAIGLQFLDRCIAHQVLHRVKHGRGVGLYCHPVSRLKDAVVQSRHDTDHRSRRGLVPAHLDPVDFGADVVGMVDHPVRQPQQAAFDGFQVRFHVSHFSSIIAPILTPRAAGNPCKAIASGAGFGRI